MLRPLRILLIDHAHLVMVLLVLGVIGVMLTLDPASPEPMPLARNDTVNGWHFSLQMDGGGLALQAVSGMLDLNVVANEDQRIFDLRVSDGASSEALRGAPAVAVAD